MKWLQISDLHFGYSGYKTNLFRQNLLKFLKENGQIDFILISGDCMYQNKGEGCTEYILELGQACHCSSDNIFICPGNHDIDLRDRDLVLFEFDGEERQFEALSYFGYEKFKKLHQEITGKTYLPYQIIERHIGREKIRILTLDSCLFLDERASQNNLSVFPSELDRLGQNIRDDEYINILTMHHGIECFEPNSRTKLKRWIENNHIDIVFCGHSVLDERNTYIDSKKQVQQFSSGVVPLSPKAIPNFWICQYEVDSPVVEMSLYSYDENGALCRSCLWNGDSYHYQLFRKKENAIGFLKSENIIKSKRGDFANEKLLYKEINALCKAVRDILNEPYDKHNSTSRSISPDGIKCYNRLANKFNLFFPEADMFIFREDTMPNLVTHPKTQEILYQLEYALGIIIEDMNQKKENMKPQDKDISETNTKNNNQDNKSVFVVHGHDEGAKQTVARFLEQCGFQAVILHEQSDCGRTIIEKIEQFSDVAFAVVLYTPCDIGRSKKDKKGKPRARQNVVFEHGYLIGRLGRSRVCALVTQGIEIPGDVAGVGYKSMDAAGAWKTELLKEMKNAGITVDATKLLYI